MAQCEGIFQCCCRQLLGSDHHHLLNPVPKVCEKARNLRLRPVRGLVRSLPTIIDSMRRELLLLRHAKSAWDTNARSDFDRPLAGRGRKAAPRVGRWLHEQGLIPDYVVSSPAIRAQQTVLAVCAELGIDAKEIHWDERIYGGWTRSLIEVLRESPADARRVLIAGHNPGLEDLLESLCAERLPAPDDGKMMPTAALARLQLDVPWAELSPGRAHLLSLTRARSLKI